MVAAYSIGRSRRQGVERAASAGVPGPAKYNPVMTARSQAPEWRIGNSKRQDIVTNKNPSPGITENDNPQPITRSSSRYPMHRKKYQHEGPQYSFGLKPHERHRTISQPGPGSYDPKPQFDKAPVTVISAQSQNVSQYRSIQHERLSPGPGTYNTNYSTIQDQYGVFGRAQRETFPNNTVSPGPGKYSLHNSFVKDTPEYSFGQSTREQRHMVSQSFTMGPGSYNIPSFLRTDHGFHIVPRRKDIFGKTFGPGPGQYQPNSTFTAHKEPVCRIGSAPRETLDRISNTVGPCSYRPNYLYTATERPRVKIGLSKRKPIYKEDEIPGPGQYRYELSTNDGPRFSLRTKKQDPIEKLRFAPSPGPQSYRPDTSQVFSRSQTMKIGQSKRNTIAITNSQPGPGHYNHPDNGIRPQQVFGRETRPLNQAKGLTPGPGQYDLKPTFADVPAYLLQK